MKRKTKEQKFRERVTHWSETIGAKPKLVQLRRMKRKWASCSTAGRVSFSRDLLKKGSDFQDSVIAHELLHLQVPNHGKLFKSLMAAYLPNWKENGKGVIDCF